MVNRASPTRVLTSSPPNNTLASPPNFTPSSLESLAGRTRSKSLAPQFRRNLLLDSPICPSTHTSGTVSDPPLHPTKFGFLPLFDFFIVYKRFIDLFFVTFDKKL
jgi:hypothetical protein